MKATSIRRKLRSAMVTGLAAVSILTLSPARAAAPSGVGSPLVGPFCSSGAGITGQGATFANNAHVDVFIPAYQNNCNKGTVGYTSNGSGAGKNAAMNHTPTFAGSDEPLSADEQLIATADGSQLRARVSPIHHIPIALGAVTVPYNLASCGLGQESLTLRAQQIGAIFSGLITKWNDPLLTLGNPQLAACGAKQIRVAVRSDGSGTTYAFKDFLSKRNPQFQVYKQNQLNTAWPAQDSGLNPVLRGNGNSGVATVVKNTDGAIGYVELSTAQKNFLTWARVDGPHLQFVSPARGTAANCADAALGATHPPSTLSPGWEAVSITDGPNPNGYPICTFTYALLFNNLRSAFAGAVTLPMAQTLVDYFGLAVDDIGQAGLEAKGYARLPITMQTIAKAGLATIAYQ